MKVPFSFKIALCQICLHPLMSELGRSLLWWALASHGTTREQSHSNRRPCCLELCSHCRFGLEQSSKMRIHRTFLKSHCHCIRVGQLDWLLVHPPVGFRSYFRVSQHTSLSLSNSDFHLNQCLSFLSFGCFLNSCFYLAANGRWSSSNHLTKDLKTVLFTSTEKTISCWIASSLIAGSDWE